MAMRCSPPWITCSPTLGTPPGALHVAVRAPAGGPSEWRALPSPLTLRMRSTASPLRSMQFQGLEASHPSLSMRGPGHLLADCSGGLRHTMPDSLPKPWPPLPGEAFLVLGSWHPSCPPDELQAAAVTPWPLSAGQHWLCCRLSSWDAMLGPSGIPGAQG